MVDALGDLVPVFKPQSAFFEAYGSAGIAVLERVLADVREAGALSLLDVKRGDIGSTMDAYAAAYLADGAPLAADAITVSPYLGFGSLAGTIALAEAAGPRGLRAGPDLQPRGPQVQHARTAAGRLVGRGDRRRGGRPPTPARRTVTSAWWSAPPSGGPGSTLTQVHGSLLAPGHRRPGRPVPPSWPRCSATRCRYVLPSASRELMGAGSGPGRGFASGPSECWPR